MAITHAMRETTVGQIADLPVPRTRGGYQTQLFERYHRRQDELDSAIGEMFVKGVSTTKVGQVIETLTGSHRSRLNGFACLPYLRE
jgi:putative transposase